MSRTPRRAKPGNRALKEIDVYQKMTRTLVPRANMDRLIREILRAIPPLVQPCDGEKTKKRKLSPLAVDVIQELAEDYIVKRFKASQIMAIHAKRITVQSEDWNNAAKIVTVLNGHEDVGDATPINERFSRKKTGKTTRTTTKKTVATTGSDDLSDAYLQELSRIDGDLQADSDDDETDSQDLCYQMEAEEEEESDSEEFQMYDEPYSL